jgi:hypothetical protein
MAKAQSEKKEAAYKAWIESHTLEEIRTANRARQWLKKHGVRGYDYLLKDHRRPKMPIRAFLAYYSQNRAELEGESFGDKSKSAAARWKTMSDAEKKVGFPEENVYVEREADSTLAIPGSGREGLGEICGRAEGSVCLSCSSLFTIGQWVDTTQVHDLTVFYLRNDTGIWVHDLFPFVLV